MGKFTNSSGSGASSTGLNKMLRGRNSGNNGQFYMQRNKQRAIEHETPKKKKDTE
ncbi:hypothetical protein [Vibrio algivorus]|uniref:Uncharacterized protein n=1 Tax=Vibrio algivorus TaxID=1667024 RepID=A0ABQ6EPZ3_9VIBR|nr:hypothetical protein [Vibrio algivorus]GLT15002.1 hypothetical protein GCM10007931_19770 [Vibrio algivorus]